MATVNTLAIRPPCRNINREKFLISFENTNLFLFQRIGRIFTSITKAIIERGRGQTIKVVRWQPHKTFLLLRRSNSRRNKLGRLLLTSF
jgi:hypothetical protein